MSALHTVDHERWLEEALTGALAALDSRAAAELARCAECQGILNKLGSLKRRIDDLAREEREVLSASGRIANAPGEDRIASTLRAAARAREASSAEEPSPRTMDEKERAAFGGKSVPRRAWILLIAALVLGAVGATYWLVRPAPVDTREVLGGEGVFTFLHPLGEVRGTPRFLWQFSGVAPGGFVVHIQGLDSSAGFEMVSVARRACPWTPSDDEYARLPAHFEWYVTALDESGEPIGSSSPQRVSLLR